MAIPDDPKIYHIIHVDKLPSVIADGFLWSDAEVQRRSSPGTTIGMPHIKNRRLHINKLASHPGLYVGDCVPFYFCPRSVMLYLIYKANHNDLTYQGGQGPIVHLEANLKEADVWAKSHNQRWAFTLSNAGSGYFEDRSDLANLCEINWDAVQAATWVGCREEKQAEFLMEKQFPVELIRRIGVRSNSVYIKVMQALEAVEVVPSVEIIPAWYY